MEINQEYLDKIGEALENEDVAKAIAAAASPEEIKAIFNAKGIEIDDNTANAAIAKLNEIRENGGEMSIEDLEMVAGGKKGAGWIAIGALVGGVMVSTGVLAAPGAILLGSTIACAGVVYSDTRR